MMGRLSISDRKRVIILRRHGCSISEIKMKLQQENVHMTVRSLQKLCKKFQDKHTIQHLPRRSRPRKLTQEMSILLDDILKENDEASARQIQTNLCEKFSSLHASLATIKQVRKENGWGCTRPHYCLLIREVNKVKQKEWCQQQIANKEFQ